MKGLSILGSTGSIGTQTLEVVAASPERLSVAALAAHTNDALLEAQIRKFRPHVAALSDEKAAARLRARYDGPTEILSGEEGILACATVGEADTVLGAMVGYAGLKPIQPIRTSPLPIKKPLLQPEALSWTRLKKMACA